MSRSTVVGLIALACLVTLVNAFKPLAVDDTVYYWYARHIAAHPLDPYGFQLYGGQPANEVLAPPALLYWWAGAYRLFGEQPFLWKLWLLPFPLILAFSLHAVGRRFTRGLEAPLVALALLSPALLPCLNLMLDLPALALSLLAAAVFFRACDRTSLTLAAAAGLIAGLAMETKYTAFTAPALMLLYGLCSRRVRLGIVAAGLAVLIFVAWEWFTAASYGASHFLLASKDRVPSLRDKLPLIQPLIGILGETAPAVALLGLAALRLRRRVVAAAAAVVLGVALAACLPSPFGVPVGGGGSSRQLAIAGNVVLGLLGLTWVGVVGAAAWRLCRLSRPGALRWRHWLRWRVEAFLVLWLGLELGAYFALSPYPAVRRVLALVVVSAVLIGRLASRTCRSQPRVRLVWGIAAVGLLLAVPAFAADFFGCRAEQIAAERAMRRIRRQDPQAAVWFHDGGGGFEFYAGRAGMKPWQYGGPQPRSGDWVVCFVRRAGAEAKYPIDDRCTPATSFQVRPPVPLRSKFQYGGAAWEHFEGALLEVALCRMK